MDTRTDPDLVLVYGTLRPAVPNSRFPLLGPTEPLGGASFSGLLFNLEGYPGAIPVSDPARRVRGEVFRLLDPVESLRRMDRYEGYVAGDPGDCEFRRERARVLCDGGDEKEVWIYYYNLPIEGLVPIPDGDYVAFLRDRVHRSAQQHQQQQQ